MAGDHLFDLVLKIVQKCLAKETLTEFQYGTVTSVNPFQIYLDSQITMPSSFLVLSELCQRKAVVIHGEEVELWPDLQIGNKVRLLRCQNGQLYYVLDRQ